jgi:puromycin-sensitive aminopeptidase
MLEQHIGSELFREGVRLYLERHQFGNAETTDLWKALGDASRQPIPEVMDGWIFQPGYPLVRVEAHGQGLRLSQQRFTYLGEDLGGRWRIPVVLRAWVKRGIIEKHVLLDGDDLVVPLPAAPDWAIVNAGGHGFYRVGYAPPLLKKLSGALPRLLPIERFNLVSDAFALAQSGATTGPEYLDLTARFTDETDRNVWTAIIGSLAFVNRVIAPEHRPGFEALVRHRLTPAVERLGWEAEPDDSDLARQLRADLLRAMGVLGNDPVTQERARELYARQRAGGGTVEANVLPALIAIVAASGGEAEYAEFWESFRSARTPQEEQRFLFALAGFRNPDLVQRTLERTIGGEVRSQDAPFLMRALLGSVHARERAWAFVKEHWQTMARLYPPSAYRRMYEGVTGLVSPEWEGEVREFFPRHGIDLGGKTLEQYLEQLRVAVRFQEREREGLGTYLSRPRR